MTQHTTVEDQVIDVLHHTRTYDLEAIMRQCTNLTWSHVFLAVNRVSRRGWKDGVGLGRWLKETGI
jgi:hypothetical protein